MAKYGIKSEIENQWSLYDVLNAHEALDAIEDSEKREADRIRSSRKGR